ncbi:MAG: VacJ family lipoprotein [Deltaproteobacteria bacterium]|nr:VacJ family lipoprotein [Deltaproteobacteria bacterium]
MRYRSLVLINCLLLSFLQVKCQNDPFEKVNRFIYSINWMIDSSFFRPFTEVYLKLPASSREVISNFFSNLNSPIRIVSFLIAGEIRNARIEFLSFTTNSTLGLGGLLKPSENLKLSAPEFDLDMALKSLGIDTGPFLVLPIIGPSSLRGVIPLCLSNMLSVDFFLINNGHSWWYGATLLEVLDKRASLEPVIETAEKMSFDTYVFLRNFYLSKRSISFGSKDDEF